MQVFSPADYDEAEQELLAELEAGGEGELMPEHQTDSMDGRKCPRCTLIAMKMVEIRNQRKGLAN